ncbi:hypothetical protein [Candidatus Venteria ishoeyi]|uniref:Uncharacterized protein n=1 Tax=Candidatus Venteria ishoeyi TaxID=1899563 RepID=A0A1H6FFA6_9GAMM|nr:hypothetical protein [Candidatus Venteria ishoeyi]SEH08101.1 Uncharacterised protein [Candidatus Venteria ishoeyi]
MNIQLFFAWVLFIGGISLALISAAQMPVSGATWPDTLPVYILVLTMGLLGSLWIRQLNSSSQQTQTNLSTASGIDNNADKVVSLQHIRHLFQQLQQDLIHLQAINDRQVLQAEFEKLEANYLLHIIASRTVLKNHLAQAQSALLLNQLAQGERLFNRLVSANIDGHAAEVQRLFPQLIELVKQWQEVLK